MQNHFNSHMSSLKIDAESTPLWDRILLDLLHL